MTATATNDRWRDPDTYAWTAELSGAEWAWQFLRRSPSYRRDWRWFDRTWRALERDYGVPPERDFQAWQSDSRAWCAAPVDPACAGATCAGDGERLLIECWMGARWGFSKFPVDPDRARPAIPGELCWIDVEPIPSVVRQDDRAYLDADPVKLALGFDLGLPLKSQLEEARRVLIVMQRQLRQRDRLQPYTVRGQAPRWTLLLRLLDAVADGAHPAAIAAALDQAPETVADLRQEAEALCAGGYRRLPALFDR